MAHDVFISYASADQAVAFEVCSALEERGIRCWVAPRDVQPGSDYGASLLDAISDSSAVVLILSGESNKSPLVRREVERAASKDITIVPFLIEKVTLSKSLEYFISTHHWLDATSKPTEQHIQKLADTVEKLTWTRPTGLGRGKQDAPSRTARDAPAGTEELHGGQAAAVSSLPLRRMRRDAGSHASPEPPTEPAGGGAAMTEVKFPPGSSRSRPEGTNETGARPSSLVLVWALVVLVPLMAYIGFRLLTPKGHRQSTASVQGKTMILLGTNEHGYAEYLWLKDSSVVVRVPAGSFTEGSDDGDPGESGTHQRYLGEFYIDKYEVTNRQFARFARATGYATDAEQKGSGWTVAGNPLDPTLRKGLNWRYYHNALTDRHPVVAVSWNDAQAYCRWAGKRLTSEAEWEKTARGSEGRTYPWGNEPPDGTRCNYADRNTDYSWSNKQEDDGYRTTAPVGTYAKGTSPYGCMDMAGNVWEWCAGPPDSDSMERPMRGGAWHNTLRKLRSAVRAACGAQVSSDDFGFRCAVAANHETPAPSHVPAHPPRREKEQKPPATGK